MNKLNYGVIGNCRSAALVSESGSIDWCCLPDFDSPSLFARMLDEDNGGSFGFLVDDTYRIGQKYFYRTNILCTEFVSDRGSFEVIDFMPRYKTSDNDYFAPAEIYRYLRLKFGQPSIRMLYQPKLNYALEPTEHEICGNSIRTYSSVNPSNCVYLYSSVDFNDILESREVRLTGNHYFLISYNQKLIDIDLNRVYLEYQRTKVYWLNWNNRSVRFTEYQDEIHRSLLVLKLMSYHSTGAVLAAITTSIPEAIGEARNWDYRFCWLRDASMSIRTLLHTGHDIAAQRFLGFIKRILKSKQDRFQIMYGIRGERDLLEYELPHLAGFENSRPVRIGNAAYHQAQNDVFGYLLDVILQYYEFFPGTLDDIEDIWEIVRNICRSVSAQWQKPDRGIWELRNVECHFVLSKVMSWVAFDRASRIAGLLNRTDYEAEWRSVAGQIREDVMKNGWNEQIQSFTQTYGTCQVDASLLLLADYGFMDPDDYRFERTVISVQDALFYKGLIYRYVNPDDFGKPTTSFTICNFWLIRALFRIGRREEAKAIFDDLLKCGNSLGLFSEDIDFETRRLLGNFPQAYSHLALINTAILFSKEERMSKFIKP